MTEQLYSDFRLYFDLDPLVIAQDAIETISNLGLSFFENEFLPLMPKALQAKYLTCLLSLFWDDPPDKPVT